MVALRGHFDGKVIVPDGPVDLPRGQALIVHVEVERKTEPPTTTSAMDWIADNAVESPAIPVDGAVRHDHYLYGTPKEP